MRAMTQLNQEATEERIPEGSLIIELPLLEKGGIRTHDLVGIHHPQRSKANEIGKMEEGNDIVAVLNDQSELLWEWRTQITQLLTEPLNNGGNEADGQEYQRNLDNQGEAETHLRAYAALLADRREALSSERNLLAVHEGRERKTRSTKASKRARDAAAMNWEGADDEMQGLEQLDDDAEQRPEDEVLFKELSDERKKLLLSLNGRAMKSVCD